MFFAETVFISAHPAVEYGLPALATLAGVFAVAYSLRFGHDVFFGPPPTDLPRPPHEPVHWMRVPVELLVLACLVVGVLPAWSIGAVPGHRGAAGGRRHPARVQPGALARLQHAAADEPDRHCRRHRCSTCASPRPSSARSAAARRGLLGLDGKRIFEFVMALASRPVAAGLARALGTRRLQPQLLWLVRDRRVWRGWPRR